MACPAIVLGSDILVAMELFHVLLTVTLALGVISTAGVEAFVLLWGLGMSVIHMTVPLLLSWPPELIVLAFGIKALPWPSVHFLVFAIVQC